MIIVIGLLVLVLFCRIRAWFYGLLHEMLDNCLVTWYNSFQEARVRFPDAARDIARGIRDGSVRSLVRAVVVVVARNGKPAPQIALQQY